MEEESEVLDWSIEDDEAQASESLRAHPQQKESDSGATWSGGDQEEAEDAVSLGGDEDEDPYPYTATGQDRGRTPKQQDSPARASSQSRTSVDYRHDSQQRDGFDTSANLTPRKAEQFQSHHTQSLGKLTHALPPKPVVAPPPYIAPAAVHPGILASSMVPRERRPNGHPKPPSNSQDSHDSLPPDWEMRYPRTGSHEAYYYNVQTHESTWERPRTLASRRSSPSKERETNIMQSGGAPSPVRGLTNETARNIRNDMSRRVSPGGTLTYNDRHYRPEEQSGSDQKARRDTFPTSPVASHIRPLSPPPRLPAERRVARSPSQRRSRSLERTGRGGRRDISPSAPDRSSWRASPRDDRPARQSPVQTRGWGRPRDASPVENGTTRPYDKRSVIERGRRHRADIEPPLHIPQDTRNNPTSELSASRRRSPPPHLRKPSPPRRGPPADLPQRPPSPRNRSRFDRPPSPPSGKEQSRSLITSSYASADRVPQRRARDPETEYGNEPKRRRVDSANEDSRYGTFADDALKERTSPASHSSQIDQPRSRRIPLPSQSDRFREVSHHPPDAAPSVHAPPNQPMDEQRGSARNYRDTPSGPRNYPQPSQAAPDLEKNTANGPSRMLSFSGREPARLDNPTVPALPSPALEKGGSTAPTRVLSFSGRARTRFDAPLPGTTPTSTSIPSDRARVPMDVDYPPRSTLFQADDVTPRAALNTRSEYPSESTMNTVPTGPRAMSRNTSGIVSQRDSPHTTAPVGHRRSSPFRTPRVIMPHFEYPPPKIMDHLPPSPPPVSVHEVFGMPQYVAQSLPQGPRGYEPVRSMPLSSESKSYSPHSHNNNSNNNNNKLSGTNSIPLGNKGPGDPQNPIGPARASADPWRADRGSIIYQTEPRRIPSPENYDILRMPILSTVHRMPPPERSETSAMSSQRSYTPPLPSQPPARPSREKSPHITNERSGRPSRFGPEPAQATQSTKSEERVWLTREESKRLERTEPPGPNKPPVWGDKAYTTRGHHAHSHSRDAVSRSPVEERSSRQFEQQPPRLPQERNQDRFSDSRQRGRPASLERRLSSQVEPTSHPTPSRPYTGRGMPSGDEVMRHDDRPTITYRKNEQPIREEREVRGRETKQARDASPPSTKIHPDRVRYLGDPPSANDRDRRPGDRRPWSDSFKHPLPPQPIHEPSPKPNTPVRIRRPDPSIVHDEREELSRSYREQSLSDRLVAADPAPQRPPPVQRGGSLLDRLTLSTPPPILPGPSPSLRDRVELPMKRANEEVHGLPPRPPAEVTNDAEFVMDGRGGRGGGRRRGGKPKRGRRGM